MLVQPAHFFSSVLHVIETRPACQVPQIVNDGVTIARAITLQELW